MSLSNVNIQIVGRIGQDAIVRQVKDYFAISFSVAVSEKRANDQWVTTWFNLTYWSKSNKIAQHLTKGRLVSVVCDWMEVNENNGKIYTSFRVKDCNPFLEKKETAPVVNTADPNYSQPISTEDPIDDDLPF